MSNTEFKSRNLPRALLTKGSQARLVSYPSGLLGGPWKTALQGHDHTPAAHRSLVTQHGGGAGEWMVLSSATAGSQIYPEPDVVRTVSVSRAQLAPGCALALRIVAVRSGLTQFYRVTPPGWIDWGIQGAVKVTIDYENLSADTTSVSTTVQLAPSQEDNGAELGTAGASWGSLLFAYVPLLRPPETVDDFAEASRWSEDTSITISIAHLGGARVIHTSVVEIPHTHVTDHATSDVTIHQWGAEQPPLSRPQTEGPDGVTYSDLRFGTTRGFTAAQRQSQQLGPIIASWSCYGEDVAEVTDTTPDAITTSSTTFVGLSMGTGITAWDPDHPGFDISGHYAQRAPECLATRLDGAATIPVRVRVHARFSGAGSNTGIVRFQTTERSWIEVEIDQATVGSTWTWVTVTGWLECSVAVDDSLPVLVDLFKTSGGTLEVRYWAIEFGDFTVAS
jgi:hypothetical protein